jgi:predicted ATPase
MPPLGRLIARAAKHSQIWIVTHSETLAQVIYEETGAPPRRIVKEQGETGIEGLGLDGEFDD